MLKQLWKDVPVGFKVFWGVSVMLGLSFSAILLTLLIKLFLKL